MTLAAKQALRLGPVIATGAAGVGYVAGRNAPKDLGELVLTNRWQHVSASQPITKHAPHLSVSAKQHVEVAVDGIVSDTDGLKHDINLGKQNYGVSFEVFITPGA